MVLGHILYRLVIMMFNILHLMPFLIQIHWVILMHYMVHRHILIHLILKDSTLSWWNMWIWLKKWKLTDSVIILSINIWRFRMMRMMRIDRMIRIRMMWRWRFYVWLLFLRRRLMTWLRQLYLIVLRTDCLILVSRFHLLYHKFLSI